MNKHEAKYYLIIGVVVLVIVGLIVSICIKQQKQQVGMLGFLGGFLFPVDGTYYLVMSSQIVIDEQEIKRQTGLDDLWPPRAKPLISKNEAKNIAKIEFNEYVNEAKENLENFDLQKCINDCETSKKVMINKTCEQYCVDYRAYLQSKYDEVAYAELKDPVLIYNENGEPVSWKVSAVKDDQIIVFFSVNPNSGACMGGGYGLGKWLTEDKAKEILKNYLSENGISYSQISEARYISYPRMSHTNF